MKTEQIFQEFEQRLEKEYYAQLASKEILTVPLLIDILKKSAEHKFYIGDTEIENSGEIAKEKVQLFLERIMNYKTKAENNC